MIIILSGLSYIYSAIVKIKQDNTNNFIHMINDNSFPIPASHKTFKF